MDLIKIKNYLTQTSKVVTFSKLTSRRYSLFEKWLGFVYANSVSYNMRKLFSENTIIAFRYSFLGKITEIRQRNNLKETLENSKFVKWSLKIYNDEKKIITDYLTTSFIANYAIGFKNQLHIFPVRIGSIIFLIVILSDMVFYTLLKDILYIGLFGWIIKSLLLFVGVMGLFCKINLENLLSTSSILKWTTGYKQRGEQYEDD